MEFLKDKDFPRMQKMIAEVLPDYLRVDRPERRNRQVEKMLRAFQYNLSALSFVALLVGLYLIYNMISLSVVRRRTEIGTLRAMGATPGLIASIFLLEAGVIGAHRLRDWSRIRILYGGIFAGSGCHHRQQSVRPDASH